MFFHSPGATSTRAEMLRRASASCTSGMERTARRKSSSKSSAVWTVPLEGWMAAKLVAKPSDKMVRALRMIPMANRPTAMDSTINSVRDLLPNRWLMTLYQRGLSICASVDHFPVGEGDDARTAFRHILVVRHQQDRAALPRQLDEQVDDCRR